ncbi:FIS1 [Cordylochernes scorpioides]|uniref:Mitochondrial fission 1 protein n=1 Tax=Cordylochernes scorpioides TaxID=51811 RepID=A0ABY6KPQ5_9ARAC|nr:FIS1 [Cordylochernes scorpioides]
MFEERYKAQRDENKLTNKDKFEYAWCLIRSRYSIDIRKGVVMFEDLFKNGDETAKRDYLFYLAIGMAKLKDYQKALRYVKAFLTVEPENRQAKDLEALISQRMKKGIVQYWINSAVTNWLVVTEGLMGAAIVGGAVIALGGLVGLGVALARK